MVSYDMDDQAANRPSNRLMSRREMLGMSVAALSNSASGADARTPGSSASPRIVAYGDSIAHMMAASVGRQGTAVVNMGIGGVGLINGTPEDRARSKNYVAAMKPGDIVLVSLGTNDAYYIRHRQIAPDAYRAKLEGRLQAIKDTGATAVVFGTSTGVYTSGSPQWDAYVNTTMNDIVRSAAGTVGLRFMETGGGKYERESDQLHYSDAGFARLLADGVAMAKKPYTPSDAAAEPRGRLPTPQTKP
jgi:lysophospholipase L1-like esterase